MPQLVFSETLPALRMYQDPHYQRWRKMLAEAQDYFYQGPVVRWVQNSGHRRIKTIRDRLNPQDILDLGCGDGAHLPFVRDRSRVLSLDIDQPSLLKLSQRFPETPVMRADGFNLPFKDTSFGCLLNIYNLEHMVFLDLALEEMKRILKPEGVALVSVPSVGSLAAELARTISTARHFNTQDFDYDRVSELEHVNCIAQLEKAFRRHFLVKQRFLFPFNLPVLPLSISVTYVLQAC